MKRLLVETKTKLNLALLRASQRTSSTIIVKGIGHIAPKCPTKFKSTKKGLVTNATWDDSSKSESESDEPHHKETKN